MYIVTIKEIHSLTEYEGQVEFKTFAKAYKYIRSLYQTALAQGYYLDVHTVIV